jgi:AsmA family protein
MVRILKWIGIALAALLVVVFGAAAIVTLRPDSLRNSITQLVAGQIHRPVSAQRMQDLHLLTLHPSATFTGVTVGNPSWAQRKEFVRIGRIELQIDLLPLLTGSFVLPRVDSQNTEIYLLRNAKDQANWRIGTEDGSPASTASNPPLIDRFNLRQAHVQLTDDIRGITLDGSVSAVDQAPGRKSWTHLDGNGLANGKPFTIAANGQPLTGLRADRPYLLTVDIHEGATHAGGLVSINRPFEIDRLEARLKGTGPDIAELSHLTRIGLPNTAAYDLTTHLIRDGMKVRLAELRGTVGSSDVAGELDVDRSNGRTGITANITSRKLNFSDFTASRSAALNSAADIKRRKPPSDHLIPDVPLDPVRLRRIDTLLHLHADDLETHTRPVSDLSAQLRLDHGVMTIQPLSFMFAQGRVTGSARVDATRDDPELSLDGRVTDIQLSQFHKKEGAPPVQGGLDGRIVLKGKGRSLREAISGADGTVIVVVPHGEVDSAGLILTGTERTDIRCGIGQFKAVKGTWVAENLILDTQDVLITGKGEIDVGKEIWDLTLTGQSKKPRLRLKAPISVRGNLLHPSFGLAAGNSVGQGGVAIGLGALLSRVAAVLAFIDPGLGKNADCSALLQEAHEQGSPTKTASAKPDAGQAATQAR